VTSRRTFVLVGGGQASAVAARTLRRSGFDGRLVIIGEEDERPYQRPPLSKEYLETGDAASLELLPEAWTEQQSVEVRSGVRAMKISAPDGGVLLDDGSFLPADRVLLATGARARRLPSLEGDGIFYLRSRADADALREHLVPGAHVALVGGGFIGAELASAARSRGADVTLLEAGPVPLAQAVGPRLGEACARLQREAGVDVRVDSLVSDVRGEAGGRMVLSTTGGDVEADIVVVGVGAVPNEEIAVDSGIDVGNGILVDEYGRTSLDHVFAAGDVANQIHPGTGRRLRVEHFDNASRQAAVAARNMLGEFTPYNEPHWFWSDQFGRNLQYAGHASPTDRMVVRGDLDADSWSAYFLEDGRVTAVFALDAGDDVALARELIRMRISVPEAQLTDPEVDLFDLMEDD
jgi:3-phenylpropionate/trans-cinnamate dioxygenase ferredoxin reductase subunit